MKARHYFRMLASVAALLAGPAFSDVIVGSPPTPNTGNCDPFTCFLGEYQQVYTASAFSGPITITDLEFFNTQFDSGATSTNSLTFTIALSTTAIDWNTISAVSASNIGSDNTVVFSGSLLQPWAFGDTLHIIFSAPFTYTPAVGSNLLMDVTVSGRTPPFGLNTFLDDSTGTVMTRATGTSPGSIDRGFGLVTGFSTGTIGTAPEPATLALLGIGLAGIGFARRRKLR